MGGFLGKLLGRNEQDIHTPAVQAPQSLRTTEQEGAEIANSNDRKLKARGKRNLTISTVGTNGGASGVGTNV